ncbi:MAG: CRISPR-associated helicase Cas3', partial [Candidatus Oleimicrobiaceae bacterium]
MRAPCVWPDWLDAVWAKGPTAPGDLGETLAQHTWAVLCRVADFARLRPGLPQVLGLPRLWHVLFWAAFLHDWGKVAPRFQAALRGGPRWYHRHEVLSLAFLNWVAPVLDGEEAGWVAACICMHHKDWPELQPLYPAGLSPEDDPVFDLLEGLPENAVRGLWRWLDEAAADWVSALELDRLGVGVRVPPPADAATGQVLNEGAFWIREWMRRCHRLVRDMESSDAERLRMWLLVLRGSLLQSDHTASAHVGSLPAPNIRRERILGATRLAWNALYPHQREASVSRASAILIAPTGSGKTESALLWLAGLEEAQGTLARAFYTLPYQASMNAMYDRLRGIFPDQVTLLHGKSALALYRRFMDQDYTPAEARRLVHSQQDMARLQVPPIRVFSPYHMLKAAYQLKGYEAMLSDYTQAAFVLDEIHAYEPGRLAMILETVRFLRENLGAFFLVMTATLPAPVRGHLEEALGKPRVIRASPDVFQDFARHRLHLLPGDLLTESGLDAIGSTFRDGQSVLVTCNTVARSQQAYQSLKARMPEVSPEQIVLIHGRFNARDRLAKERDIIAATGIGCAGRQPVLVVSTQVVEVSLNIDLDTIFSDPAPLEALVQRFGRVNRRRRLALAPVRVFTELSDGQGVYDPRHVQATLQILRAEAQDKALDEGAIQVWLDCIYQGSVLEDWEKAYVRQSVEVRAAFLDGLRPFVAASGLEDEFSRLFDGTEVLPATLKEEYDALKEERPLESAELLVP